MRTYVQIYKEYADWLVTKTKDDKYSYDSTVERLGSVKNAHIYFYKQLLKLCYGEDGMFYFCKFIIGDLMDCGYPKPFRYNGVLHKWNTLINKHSKISVLASRGLGKTIFFSEILSLFDMFKYKHFRIIIVSASGDQSIHILDEIKTIVTNNEWLRTKKDKGNWASQKIGFNSGYIMGVGVGSEILGQHVNRVILDDILRDDNKLSDEQTEDYIDMKLDPMLLNRNGQMILVGTPKRLSDYFNVIKKRIAESPDCPWVVREYPAIIDEDKKILQAPYRFTWESIMAKKASMGPLKFAREYQLQFFSRDKSLFPRSVLETAKDMGRDCIMETGKPVSRGGNWIYIAGADVARSGSASADFTVVFVLAYDTVKQIKQIVYKWKSKGLKMGQQAAKISEISKRFNDCGVVVETNNMGQDLIDRLVDDFNVYVEPMTVSGAAKKEELVRFLVQNFENEKVILPMGDDYSREMSLDLISELEMFGVTRTAAGNERYCAVGGGHDDQVMALAHAMKGTQILGMPYAVTNFEDHSYSNSLTKLTNTDETDLVKLINMGFYD